MLHAIELGGDVAAKGRRGGPQPGAGRKPLPPEERFRNRVTLNFDDAQYQALLDAAGAESPSIFARRELVRLLARRARR